MKKAIFLLTATAAFLSCSKGGSDDDNPTPGPSGNNTVTVQTLMGTTGKRWPMSEATLTYYSASGSVDSTITLTPTSSFSSIYFTNNNGAGGLYLNFDAQAPLTRVLPGFGSFSLNQSAQKITFTCISPYCNGTDGEWQITSHVIVTLNPLLEGLDLERTVSLTAGRKVKQKIELLIF